MFRYKTLQRPSEKNISKSDRTFIAHSERMQYARKGYLKPLPQIRPLSFKYSRTNRRLMAWMSAG